MTRVWLLSASWMCEVVFGGITAAHAFLAQQEVLDVDARHVVRAGRDLDRISGPDPRQRVLQRAAGAVIVVAVAEIEALGGDEARADDVVVALDDARRAATAASSRNPTGR